MATRLVVSLPDEPEYSVRIGAGVLDALGRNVREIERLQKVRDALILTDSNVGPLYLARAKGALSSEGFKVAEITVPAGEASKSIEVAAEVWSAMAQLALGRDCLVVALGGGVVGDLAGFVASTYMRGVPVVQVPTTLLAMVDSSVGGKTAVNLPEGKNLVGTFYQPTFVCADTSTLQSLPMREWLCGCGEVVKSAALDSDEFFFWLLDHAEDLSSRNESVVAEVVKRCVAFKASVVAQDKTESSGVRECLNFGHTLGHAIESAAGYGTFSHGACVAEGMRFALELADSLGEPVAEGFAATLGDLLDALGLRRLEFAAETAALLDAMKRDKKVRGGSVRFVLLDDISKWRVVSAPDESIIGALSRMYSERRPL